MNFEWRDFDHYEDPQFGYDDARLQVFGIA